MAGILLLCGVERENWLWQLVTPPRELIFFHKQHTVSRVTGCGSNAGMAIKTDTSPSIVNSLIIQQQCFKAASLPDNFNCL